MKLPVLGESRLLGRHWVETALARGHESTPFNRGRTAPELSAGPQQLRGERDT
jgi:putative NADH-flavin reductase